ncbi:glutamate 5-kinase (plasmid) [Cytobacillus spongiae]|uniref:glutamate 5-kinase n=1 Tax=Cytobacillus spongiae TaxID=2901381 RepID=UPI00145EA962|nr:glutamate 5-kinase [Cytobacillus spongiae]MCA1062881.1 glutamate 5-kinase [Rossellomorea aquimaris]NMH70214.1 glutamate 5-kinase [Bacillus sp. RO3]UII58487.1 glutamate 5-kinase [Cytobacillus spongiae]WJV28490.1 glutamate 5-kinase [Rossellomorea sp. AcN35-11]
MSQNNQKKRIVIKIGSSSLTSLHGEMSRRKLERLVDEVVRLKDDGHEVLLVSSGAVAAGYRKLGCLTRPSSLPEKQAAAAIGQGLLIEAYSDLLISNGYVASQILITRSDFSDEDRYNNARNTINVLLERGIIPIVNENDTVTIDRLKFGDNDTLSAKVAALVDADQLIILSDIDGLYDSDPRKNPDAKLLECVTEITEEIEDMAGEPGSAVGTGGMRSKIDAFKITMASGIPAFLGKSGNSNIIYDAVQHTAKGTYFESEEDSVNLDSKKQWIAFNSGPEGEITIDASAKERILEQKESLTIEDIYAVNGRFDKGAVVRILDHQNEEIGLGMVNFRSGNLKNPTNIKSDQIAVEIDHLVCHVEVPIPVGV